MSLVYSRFASSLPLIAAAFGCVSGVVGCASTASDSDKVKITHNTADVASCQSLGRLKVPRNEYGDVNLNVAERQFRSQTVSLGGNTAYVNVGPLGHIMEATAYRCP